MALTKTLLDYGFVTLRNVSGPTRRIFADELDSDFRDFDADDIDPANTARMSFDQTDSDVIRLKDGGTRPRERSDDLKLCDYLMRNVHTTPFEMIEIWLEMKLPIFLARQFVRHRTCTINEVSGRYVTLPAEWYIPEVVGGKPVNAKQGQSDNLDQDTQDWFKEVLNQNCRNSYEDYIRSINAGVAAEHARLLLHLNHYTHWIWKQDLHNMMHFLSLRVDSHAQIEAQQFSKAIVELLCKALPESMELFFKYRMKK